jgi:hypothetical protein
VGEGTGTPVLVPVPSAHQGRVCDHPATRIKRWSPVMHPDPMPSINLGGVLVPRGAAYDSDHHWRTDTGTVRASVRFEVGGYSAAHLQGEPAALRELAAALLLATDQADAAYATSDPARPAAGVVAS